MQGAEISLKLENFQTSKECRDLQIFLEEGDYRAECGLWTWHLTIIAQQNQPSAHAKLAARGLQHVIYNVDISLFQQHLQQRGHCILQGIPRGRDDETELLKHFRNKMQHKLGASAYKCLIINYPVLAPWTYCSTLHRSCSAAAATAVKAHQLIPHQQSRDPPGCAPSLKLPDSELL